MMKFLQIFEEPESRDDKLRRMWTKIYDAEQRRKKERDIDKEELE